MMLHFLFDKLTNYLEDIIPGTESYLDSIDWSCAPNGQQATFLVFIRKSTHQRKRESRTPGGHSPKMNWITHLPKQSLTFSCHGIALYPYDSYIAHFPVNVHSHALFSLLVLPAYKVLISFIPGYVSMAEPDRHQSFLSHSWGIFHEHLFRSLLARMIPLLISRRLSRRNSLLLLQMWMPAFSSSGQPPFSHDGW